MHFLRLIRPLNLIIVAMTMYGTAWYFEGISWVPPEADMFSATFSLLVFSTVLIAAAGNIINDYFDVRADRVNKPKRLIIGVHVKPRVAIVSHWGLNFIAFSIAIYLSWTLNTFWYLFIHLFTINILWFYSMYLKRTFLTGNIAIAALTGMVPILVGFYYYQALEVGEYMMVQISPFPFMEYSGRSYILWMVFGMATFAFILNLAREIVKDMEDVEGDKYLHSKSLPIVLGYTKTKWIVGFVLSGAVFCSVLLWVTFDEVETVAMLPIILSAVLVLVCFVLLSKAKEKSDFRRINHLIKLAMVFGLLSPVYWQLMMIYG